MTPGRTAADDGGPDYRVTLANERTFLAWIRTALAAAAASVAVTYLVDDVSPVVRRTLAALLGASALVGALWAARRWRVVEDGTTRGRPITARRAPWVVALVTSAVAAGAVVLAVTAR